MTPERVARLVARWVRFYTRNLPTDVARRRREEIAGDVQENIAHDRACGTAERRIALGILSRMVRGVAADASWRGGQAKAIARRPAVRVGRATALVLLIPLVAEQLSDGMAWTLSDFVFAGVLVFSAGMAYELVARRAGNLAYRADVGVAVGAGFILVWLIGAAGVIAEDGDRADLMYGGVLAVGIVGALIARFRPHGMARALAATAAAQALVAVIALITGQHDDPATSAIELLGLSAFFVALFMASAWLFRHAAREQARPGPGA